MFLLFSIVLRVRNKGDDDSVVGLPNCYRPTPHLDNAGRGPFKMLGGI